MTVQARRVRPSLSTEAMWELGADVVAILVALAFWYGVAYSTVWALRWLVGFVTELPDTISPAWYVVPIGFSLVEMAVYKLGSRLPLYVCRAGRGVTIFDAATTIVGLFLLLLFSGRIAPYLSAHPIYTVVALGVVSVLLGWKMTLWPEKIISDAIASIIRILKPFFKEA